MGGRRRAALLRSIELIVSLGPVRLFVFKGGSNFCGALMFGAALRVNGTCLNVPYGEPGSGKVSFGGTLALG